FRVCALSYAPSTPVFALALHDALPILPGATATVAPGDDLPFTPSFQGSFGVAYEFPVSGDLTLTPRFDGSYTSKITFITGSVPEDRKSTRLNSSHVKISYAVFCLKKKK